jgi:hypothetical protein
MTNFAMPVKHARISPIHLRIWNWCSWAANAQPSLARKSREVPEESLTGFGIEGTRVKSTTMRQLTSVFYSHLFDSASELCKFNE